MKIDGKSLAVGMVLALLFMGCLVAVTNTNAYPGARYEVHFSNNATDGNHYYVVLDTQTGTTVTWNDKQTGVVREFNP